MANTIIGVFNDRSDAEKTIDILQTKGYNLKDISLVMKDREQVQEVKDDTTIVNMKIMLIRQ